MFRSIRIGLIVIALCFVSSQCQKNRGSEESAKTNETIRWQNDLTAGFQKSKQENKPLMIEFTADWCPYCRMMEDSVFSQPEVIRKTGQFVPVRIDVDKQPEIADQYQANARKYGGSGIPNVLFMNSDGEKLMHVVGYLNEQEFLAKMDSVLIIHQVK
jgi:thiol:disulfide interchange protein